MATLQEYQGAFADQSAHVHTYLVRCAIIVALLFVVVEDRLYTIEKRTAELRATVLQHDRELGNAASGLRRQYALIRQSLKRVEEQPRFLPAETVPALERVWQRLTPDAASLDAADEKVVQETIISLTEHLAAVGKDWSERVKGGGSSADSAGGGLAGATGREVQRFLEELAELRRLLSEYPAQYRVHSRRWTRENDGKSARLEEIAAMQRQSASVPTPLMIWWAAGFTLAALIVAVRSFDARQL